MDGNTKDQKKQIDWLFILRSFAVLLVVITHIMPRAEYTFLSSMPLRRFNDAFYFHMPLFFFISGYLLYYTKIQKGSSFSSVMKTRATKIIYPYLFITIAVFLIKILFVSYVKRPVDANLLTLIKYFIYPATNPWMNLWFLNVLLIYFLLYPLVKKSLYNKYTIILTCIIALSLNLFVPWGIEFLDISSLSYYFVFFYAGILGSKYKVENYLKKPVLGITFLIIFILSNWFDWSRTIHAFSAIGMSVYFSILCATYIPKLFSSFGNYYYQIYLFGTFFQALILEVFKRIGLENYFILFCIISVISAIYIPVILSKLVIKVNWKPLLRVSGF